MHPYSYGGGYGGCSCPECQKNMSREDYAHQIILIPFAKEVMGEKMEEDAEETSEQEEGMEQMEKMKAFHEAVEAGDAEKAQQLAKELAEMSKKSDMPEDESSEGESYKEEE